MSQPREPGLSTLAVHAGESTVKSDFGLVDPIHCSSTYTFANTAAIISMLEGESEERDEYARYSSPNSRTVEKKLAQLEGTEDAILCTTGMSALTLLFLGTLRPGDKLVFFDQCYHRTRQFCFQYLAAYGVICEQVPTGDFQALERAVDDRTRLLFTELPTNPHLTVIDLERFVQVAKAKDAATCIDATLASPVNHLPSKWGVDYIVHSATKYLGGHNDLLAGVLAGDRARLEPIRTLQGIIGAIAAPHTAWLLQRGLKTLPLRVQQQNKTGLAVAAYLNQHKLVKKVYYPGLPNHPSYEQAQKYLTGCGGLISFELKTDREGCARFIDSVKIPRIGPSLGGVESLIEQPAIMSYYRASEADRQRWGIDSALVRLSLGIEDAQDLLCDLDQAFGSI